MTPKKKLIEVALPLDAINAASGREKSIRHGHPSSLHLWWARRPSAAARAVIFAQMVDDPSSHPEQFPTEEAQEAERQRLFLLIEELVLWENATNQKVLKKACDEIWKGWREICHANQDHPQAKELFDPEKLPAFHDPFTGGGTLPLEAQRLGLESYASDTNPVAVLISKALIEIPPKFAGRPPVNPEIRKDKDLFKKTWRAAQGLAEDVRYYGQWMRDEAEKRIGHLYPKIEVSTQMAKERPDMKLHIGKKLNVIAWLWARTVKSPNPAYAHVDVPLVSTFMLSKRPKNEAYVVPVVEGASYSFAVKLRKPTDVEAAKNGTKLSRGANFKCLISGTPISGDYIKAEGKAGRMGARLMAIVAEGERGRVYLSPTRAMEEVARRARPEWEPEGTMVEDARAFTPFLYGMTTWSDLFTNRQLVALTTFSDLVQEAYKLVKRDALAACLSEDHSLDDGGTGATAYADAVATYASLAVSKSADLASTICHWQPNPEHLKIAPTFSRHALPMSWDFAEGNPFSDSSGNFFRQWELICRVISDACSTHPAHVEMLNATAPKNHLPKAVCSTDPPYYDNIPYADLSDYFYVWLRRSLKPVFPDLFATLAVTKSDELVATPYRHGSKEKAEEFFLDGMTQAMNRLAEQAHPAFPVTIYYAFKQSESNGEEGIASTGWDTFLGAVIRAGFAINGTWPMRTERPGRMREYGSNALASSIILVCRPRAANAPVATRREFIIELKAELPLALKLLQRSNIAPVDLAQASIGPGMAVYTRYARVLDAEGKPLSVREALMLINQTLDEVLAEQEGDFDADSRWALAWFEQTGFAEGEYGVAETLSKAKNTSVAGMVEAGIVSSKGGKVRLLRPSELSSNWDPSTDLRLSAWESVHHLVRVLEAGGESTAAELVAKIGSKAEIARELAYRLYMVCERKKRAQEALSYNGLVQSWPEIARLVWGSSKPQQSQPQLFNQV
jgi:putative DNA methylase